MSLRQLCKNCANILPVKILHTYPIRNLQREAPEPYKSWHGPCIHINTEQQFFHTPPLQRQGAKKISQSTSWHPTFVYTHPSENLDMMHMLYTGVSCALLSG